LLKQHTPVSNTLWLVAEKVVFLLLSFGVNLLLARHLQPALFGTLSFLLAGVSVLMPIMALGLNSLISRELLHRPDETMSIIGSAIALRLLVGLLMAAVAVLAAQQLLPSSQWRLFSLLVLASVSQGFFVIDFWLQARSANRYGVMVRLAVLLLVNSARLIAIHFNAGLDMFVYLLCAEWLLLACCYGQLYHRYGGLLTRLSPSRVEAVHLLRQGRWLWFTAIAAILVLKVDQLMLAYLVNDQAVGIYAAAVRLSEVWYLLPVALMTGFFPKLMEAKRASSAEYRFTLQRLCDFLLWAGIAVAIFITLTAEDLVPLLYGQAYSESVEVLVIHVWAGVFFFTAALLNRWLLIEDALIAAFYVQAVGAVANIGFNFWLIPEYGAIGAAVATLLSAMVSGYIILLLHPKLYSMGKIITWSFCLPLRLVCRLFNDS
jgi:O-antigen/teichoic acid export membrane protein